MSSFICIFFVFRIHYQESTTVVCQNRFDLFSLSKGKDDLKLIFLISDVIRAYLHKGNPRIYAFDNMYVLLVFDHRQNAELR
jgi:hypothetical protein